MVKKSKGTGRQKITVKQAESSESNNLHLKEDTQSSIYTSSLPSVTPALTWLNIILALICYKLLKLSETISEPTQFKIAIFMLSVSIIKIITGHYVIKEYLKSPINIKRLTNLVRVNFLAAATITALSIFLMLLMVNYPQRIEEFISITFPQIKKNTVSIISNVITYMTSGFAGLITTIVINVLSNYIYDKVKRKQS
jgi:hypothetical protein